MLKAYYFLWRRPDMTRAEFIDYYENIHANLIFDNLPRALDFRRNYPLWREQHENYVGSCPFDVLTAITYSDKAAFEEAMNIYHSPPFSEIVTADELRFIDRSRVRFVPVDEVSDPNESGHWLAGPRKVFKLLRLVRRAPSMEPDRFRSLYETHEVPVLRQILAGCVDYRRNYIRVADQLHFITPELQAEIADHKMVECDLVEEICFEEAGEAAAAAARLDVQAPVAELDQITRMPTVTSEQRLLVVKESVAG